MTTNSIRMVGSAHVLLLLVLSGCTPPHDDDSDAATADTTASDAGTDAAPDAPCDCDDGISCTVDACDSEGRCVHWTDCPGSENCSFHNGRFACRPTTRCHGGGECPGVPCNRLSGCWGDYCRYDWTNDSDADGVVDLECGGTDCASWTSSIPGVETCNGQDDDCNGVVDDVAVMTDPMNCGACGHACAPTATCVGGECMCPEGTRSCATFGWPTSACFDTETDPEHCGDCDTRCYSGTRCIAGVCEYRAALSVTLDARAYRGPVAFAPNGDFLIVTDGRPTRVTYVDGRPEVSIPPGASPYAQHVVRLDRTGGFIGVTSLPVSMLWLTTTRPLALTDDGFYFAGNPTTPGEYFGETFSASFDEGMVGYVPRTTSEVAWVRAIGRVIGVEAMRSGDAILSDGSYYPDPPLRFDSHGVRLSVDARFANLSVRSVFGRTEEGFGALVDSGPGNLDPGGPLRWDGTFLLLCNDNGVLTAEIDLREAVYEGIREAQDGRWLYSGRRGLMEATRASLNILADTRSGSIAQATFDGRGVAFVQGYGPFGYPALYRWRDGVEVTLLPSAASEAIPISTLANGHGWNFRNDPLGSTASTLTRIDLPPL